MKAKQYLDPSPEVIKSLLKLNKRKDFFVLDKKLEVQLKKFPNSSFLHNLKGSSLSNQNRLEESLKSFNLALESAKKPEVILNNIGVTEIKLNRFEDAIQTISNSVDRMNGLLRKLQHSDHAEIRPLKLHEVLIEANAKCQNKKPLPTLRLDKGIGTINGDNDRLVMAITHLISNAQDATKNNGFIDICVQTTQNNVAITIEDNGEGMNEAFISNRLFKPFDSTKEGKGMGIGVYQAKEIVTQLKGTLSVESSPGEGTTFKINLPLTKTATK